MPEGIETKIPIIKPEAGDDFIAGKSVNFYWKAIKWWIVFLVVLEVLNVIFDVYAYGHWIIEVIVFSLFTFWIIKRWHVELITALTASTFLGVLAGWLLAIFDIIWYHQWWYLLNLIRRPFIITLVGLAVSVVIYLLFQNLKFKHKSKDPKGGGIYGRKKTSFNKFR